MFYTIYWFCIQGLCDQSYTSVFKYYFSNTWTGLGCSGVSLCSLGVEIELSSYTPFITDNTQCFVCGRRDHFLDQCTDYVCKRCNRRNPGHYEKFCLLQPWLAVAKRQAERARIDCPNLFWHEPLSTFIIGLTLTRRRFLEHFLTEAPEDQRCSTPQKRNKQVLFRNGLPTSHTIAFPSTATS